MKIDNKLSFAAAILAFIGTFLIVMDRFGPIHHTVDLHPKWRNLAASAKDLDTFDTKYRGGKDVGMVEENKPGFFRACSYYSSQPS